MTIEWPAVRAGAIIAASVCLPISIVANAVIDDPEESSATTLVFLVVLAGFALGGWVAAKRSVDTPYSSGGVAALVAFVLIEAVVIVTRSLRGDDIRPTLIVANGFFAYGAGLLGGALVARRRTA